jgi:diguanylate cyclase
LLPASLLAEPAIWDKHSKRLELSPFVDYRLEQGRPGLAEIAALPDDAWQNNGNDSVSLGYGRDVYWFRVSVDNRLDTEAVNLLEISYPVLDRIELYRSSAPGQEPLILGDKQPFYDRPIHHRNFVVPLEIAPNTTETLYLRVETTSSMQVPMTLWNRMPSMPPSRPGACLREFTTALCW